MGGRVRPALFYIALPPALLLVIGREEKMVRFFVVALLALAVVGCAGGLSDNRPLLAKIDGQIWQIDLNESVKVCPKANERLEDLGQEEFTSQYGNTGLSCSVAEGTISLYDDISDAEGNVDKATIEIVSQDASHASLVVQGSAKAELLLTNSLLTLSVEGEPIAVFRQPGR